MSDASAVQPGGELYLPCVLTRLTDQNPEVRVERYPHATSVAGLRKGVLATVSIILNSRSRPQPSAWRDDPAVTDSVLGLGLGDFCGVSHGREQREKLRRGILRQLAVFEPRLDSRATVVNFLSDREGSSSGVLEFEIRSVISVAPLNEEFAFRARLDLETGEAQLDDDMSP